MTEEKDTIQMNNDIPAMKKFEFIRLLDKHRWDQDKDVYDFETSTYCFDTDMSKVKDDNEKKELAKKILLAHYLVYICDRQMDYRSIFYYGGYVISKIMEDFFNEYKEKKEKFDIEDFIEKHTYSYNKSKKEGEKQYTHYLKAKDSKEKRYKQLMEDFKKKYDLLTDKNEEEKLDGYVIFASRITINDYYYIFKTLEAFTKDKTKDFFEIIEDENCNEINKLAKELFECTFSKIRLYEEGEKEKLYISGKTDENFREIYTNYSENPMEYEFKPHNVKRIWCVIRDCFDNPKFSECMKIVMTEDRFRELKKSAYEIELPGDVWNNNSKFANCFWGKQQKNFKSSAFVRKKFNESLKLHKDEENKESEVWNGCLPIHFDVTFGFVPRMCEMHNCNICPIAKYSESEQIRDIQCKDWKELYCHENEDKYCPYLLQVAGFKCKCKPGECKLKSM